MIRAILLKNIKIIDSDRFSHRTFILSFKKALFELCFSMKKSFLTVTVMCLAKDGYFANNISSDRLVHMGMSGFVVA